MTSRSPSSPPTPPDLDQRRASREAVRELVEYICLVLGRRGVPERDRDDLLQDILLAVLEAQPRYDADIAAPGKWLNAIILHHIRRWQARCARSPLATKEDYEPRDQEQNPEDLSMMRQLAHQLYQDIPLAYRDAMLAHELEGLSLEEISVSRGIPVSTAHYYVQEGKRHFDASLARWKAKHRDRGILFLPLTAKALFDADRTIPSAPDHVVDLAWRRVQRALRTPALDGSAPADPRVGETSPQPPAPTPANDPPMHTPPEWTVRPPVGPVAAALVVGVIIGAWGEAVLRATHDPIAREEVPSITAPPAPSVAIVPGPSAVASAGPTALRPRAEPAANTASAAVTDFAADQTAFDMARAAFVQGDMAGALQALERHAQRYPRSKNALERDQMWLDALVSLGRTDEACQRVERFRRTYPKGEYSKRVDDLCTAKP